jgi:hypothetical protein
LIWVWLFGLIWVWLTSWKLQGSGCDIVGRMPSVHHTPHLITHRVTAPHTPRTVTRPQGWRYHRMDGCTPIALRSRLMEDFNRNPRVVLFLLTTKVGAVPNKTPCVV